MIGSRPARVFRVSAREAGTGQETVHVQGDEGGGSGVTAQIDFLPRREVAQPQIGTIRRQNKHGFVEPDRLRQVLHHRCIEPFRCENYAGWVAYAGFSENASKCSIGIAIPAFLLLTERWRQ